MGDRGQGGQGRKRRVADFERPNARKAVPGRASAPPSASGRVRFRFDMVDVGGPFCLTGITPGDHSELLKFLRDLETMTMNELFSGQAGKTKAKDYKSAELPNRTAAARIVELQWDDFEQISVLRLTGEKRLYGFRNGSEFSIVWWDPTHQIWPSTKK